jgi:hypothetical protein
VLVACLLPGAAFADPAELPLGITDSAAALSHDLRLLVAAKMQRDWEIDAVEMTNLRGSALESLCRTRPMDRARARERLRQLRLLAGPSLDVALTQAGGDLDEVAPVLAAERTLALLDDATGHLAQCPRWQQPHQPFLGRQTIANRWVLRLDGGGLGTFRRTAGGWQYGGGGSGRVLVGWGGTGRWAAFLGAELGGAAMVSGAGDSQRLAVQVYGAVPVILRISRLQWHVDVDVAPVAHWGSNGDLRGVGSRVGTLIAVGTGRLLGTLPWAGIGLNLERMWTGEAGAAGEFTFRAGLRVGFDWDAGAKGRDRQAWRLARLGK